MMTDSAQQKNSIDFLDIRSTDQFHDWLTDHIDDVDGYNAVVEIYNKFMTTAQSLLPPGSKVELSNGTGIAHFEEGVPGNFYAIEHVHDQQNVDKLVLVFLMQGESVVECFIKANPIIKKPTLH